jgi:RNA polymerase sigma factor (sigma-70 family)
MNQSVTSSASADDQDRRPPEGFHPLSAPPGRAFVTTHWSMVWSARDKDSPESQAALDRLSEIYWPPLYHFIRREGHGVHDAQDLTQEFLSRFIHREWLGHLKDQRGKFRNFLLTMVKYFLANERDRAGAKKRGGGQTIISLDACEVEERHALEPADGLTADEAYDRRWAQAVMQRAYARLAAEYAARGKAALFEQLKELLPGKHGEQSYTQIAAALGMTEQAVKNAALSYRRRYARFVRAEIAETVVDGAQIEEELEHLKRILMR